MKRLSPVMDDLAMTPAPSMIRALLAALVSFAALTATPAQAATITVTTTYDANPPAHNGQCSFREALFNASTDTRTYADCEAGSGDDVITFSYDLFTSANQYTATIILSGRLVAGTPTGATHALEIRPPGSIAQPRVRLVAAALAPHVVMDVLPTALPFTMERINIEGGRGLGGGGGIRLLTQDATFESVHFIDNQADSGGALSQMYGNGRLRISSSRFQDNHATDGRGGAIELASTEPLHQVSIFNTAFIGNQAGSDGGAILFDVADDYTGTDTPLLDIAHSRFVDNSSGRHGGAVFAAAAYDVTQRMQLQINASLFQGNTSTRNGGGVYAGGHPLGTQTSVQVERSSFLDNRSTGNGYSGGALYASHLDMHIENSLFSENRAAMEGGLAYFGGTSSQVRALTLIGNSFHRQSQSGTGPGRTLAFVVPADASSLSLTYAGNLFDPIATPAFDSECAIIGGNVLPPTLHGGDNLSPETDCLLLGAADIQATPMVLATQSGLPMMPRFLMPQFGSPAVDAWPAEACKDRFNQPLTRDLRDTPRPSDGDSSGIADCDIGAFERLAPANNDPIFADGFE